MPKPTSFQRMQAAAERIRTEMQAALELGDYEVEAQLREQADVLGLDIRVNREGQVEVVRSEREDEE